MGGEQAGEAQAHQGPGAGLRHGGGRGAGTVGEHDVVEVGIADEPAQVAGDSALAGHAQGPKGSGIRKGIRQCLGKAYTGGEFEETGIDAVFTAADIPSAASEASSRLTSW